MQSLSFKGVLCLKKKTEVKIQGRDCWHLGTSLGLKKKQFQPKKLLQVPALELLAAKTLILEMYFFVFGFVHLFSLPLPF